MSATSNSSARSAGSRPSADQADIAVVYYAGHGLEIGGINYLIPTDARLASDRDADDESILLERLVSSADGAKRLRLIILDACRDNPFVTTMKRERKMASRAAVASGLGKVEPTSTDTLIAYAAKAGSTADDGDGQHSPFTTAVLKNLTVPGLDVRLAFGRVRDEVLKATGNRQEPFVYGSLGGGNIALVPAPATPQEASASDVKADYELVQKIGSKRAWEVFLGTHPNGFYSDLARAQIEAINAATPGSQLAALPQTPPAEPRDADAGIDRVGQGEGQRRHRGAAAFHQALSGFAAGDQRAAADRCPEQGRAGARGAGARRARGGAQGRRGGAAAGRIAQGRTRGAKKREDDERRAREAEAAEKARVAAAEAAAARKREEEERRAKALEAEQKAKAAEAERKAQEARQKAEQAERDRIAAEATAKRAPRRRTPRRRSRTEGEGDRSRAQGCEEKRKAEQAERERVTARPPRAPPQRSRPGKPRTRARRPNLPPRRKPPARASRASSNRSPPRAAKAPASDDLKAFARSVTCDRLGGLVVAALDKFKAEDAKRAAAHAELARTDPLGPGRADPSRLPDRQGRRHAQRRRPGPRSAVT